MNKKIEEDCYKNVECLQEMKSKFPLALQQIKDKYAFFLSSELENLLAELLLHENYKFDLLTEEELVNNLSIKINDNIKKQFKHKDFSIIFKYINSNLFNKGKTNLNISELKKLSFLFSNIDYKITIDDCIVLLNGNNLLLEIVSLIVENNLELIKNGEFDKITTDEVINSLIEAYCSINDIEIDESITNEKEEDLQKGKYKNEISSSYFKGVSKNKLLTSEEEKRLFTELAAGDKKARNILIERNLRLVISIAKKYIRPTIDINDLIEEGNIGLIKAIDKFDITKNTRFSTYARWWIKRTIQMYLYNNMRNVRIPAGLYEQFNNYKKVLNYLSQTLNREPTIEEIAIEMNVSVADIRELIDIFKDEVSLNSLINDNINEEIGNFIPDDLEQTDHIVELNCLSDDIKKLFYKSRLTEIEIYVLICYFGLNGHIPQTLQGISNTLKVTTERVRTIKVASIKKLKETTDINDFSIYLDNVDTVLSTKKDNKKINKDLNKISKKSSKATKNIPSADLRRIESDMSYYQSKDARLTKETSKLSKVDESQSHLYFKNIDMKKLVVQNYLYVTFEFSDKDVINYIVNTMSDDNLNILYKFYKNRSIYDSDENKKIVTKIFAEIESLLDNVKFYDDMLSNSETDVTKTYRLLKK